MTIQEAKNIVAKKYGYSEWKYLLRHIALFRDIMKAEDEAMELYADEKCKEYIALCSENKNC